MDAQDALLNDVPKFIELKDYKSIARAGADYGAYYLEAELKDGVSEEEVSFAPEAHVYKGGKRVVISFLTAAQGKMTREKMDKAIAAIFADKGYKTKADVIDLLLLVFSGWVSDMAMRNGGRPSQQPDRTNAGIGTVYLAPDEIVASVYRPIESQGKSLSA